MSFVNRDLQASHHVLQLLEKAKANASVLLDEIVDIMAIVSVDGEIIRGNAKLATIMGIPDHEMLLRKSLSAIFREETWEIFNSKLNHSENIKVEFEVPIDRASDGQRYYYYWSLTPLVHNGKNEKRLFNLVGNDISALKQSEDRLQRIYASIPLAIVTLGAGGIIEPQYSAFTAVLMDCEELTGKTLFDVLFVRSVDAIDTNQRLSFEGIGSTIGDEEVMYDIISADLPSVLKIVDKRKPCGFRWIGMKWQPIKYGGKVERLLVILDDRTDFMLLQQEKSQENLSEMNKFKRYCAIRNGDQSILPILVGEITQQLGRMTDAIKNSDVAIIKRVVHTIKGNARVGEFTVLAELCHQFETEYKDVLSNCTGNELCKIVPGFENIASEWKEIKDLYDTFGNSKARDHVSNGAAVSEEVGQLLGSYDLSDLQGLPEESMSVLYERWFLAIKRYGCESMSKIKHVLNSRVKSTCEKLGKKVSVTFDWDDNLALSPSLAAIYSECIMHLINNAIDHGIETPERRSQSGKIESGSIIIEVRRVFNSLFCAIDDDGRGIDVEKVKAKALENGVISMSSSLSMTDDDIAQLVFSPNLSTADKITQVSGRGIGLDVVAANARSCGGSIRAMRSNRGGARFEFVLNAKPIPIQRRLIDLHDFSDLLLGVLKGQGGSISSIDFEVPETTLLFVDPLRLSMSIANDIGYYRTMGHRMIIRHNGNGLAVDTHTVEFVCPVLGLSDASSVRPEILQTKIESDIFLDLHHGRTEITDDKIIITADYLIKSGELPPVRIRADLSSTSAIAFINQLQNFFAGYHITFDIKPDNLSDLYLSESSISGEIFLSPNDSWQDLKRKVFKSIEQHLHKGGSRG